jgi:tRNA (uracil-5-)-methyltransferase TRM9
MKPDTIKSLFELNRRFYADFSSSFAATRRRIQPGVRRILDWLPDSPADIWLDLGCGSGALAVEWLRAGRQSHYLGVDFSDSLLAEAERAISALPGHEKIAFAPANLINPGWAGEQPGPFRGILCFAVLHHLPSWKVRERLMEQVADLLPTGGYFAFSVWQFQHSPKLLARRVPWEQAGLSPEDLEPGDTLLDWRAVDPRQEGQVGLRYVHLFERDELADMAQSSGFQIFETFESDGQGSRLGLYQVWIKKSPPS